MNAWAGEQDIPVIAVGDYNFDWSVADGDIHHDQGYDNLTENDVFTWLRPDELIRTQYSHGTPNRHSVLDFVFLANSEAFFAGTSEIIRVLNDFPDNESTPDHRPVAATLTVVEGGEPGPGTLKQQLLQRIAQLEAELAELKSLVQTIDDQ